MKDVKTWNELAEEIARLMQERDALIKALKDVVTKGDPCVYCANDCNWKEYVCNRFEWRGIDA